MIVSALCSLSALEVYSVSGEMISYDLEKLRKAELESFETSREKDGKLISESWQGINLQKWLSEINFSLFQSIRFESPDNYMVRFSKAEFDSVPGYIALKREGRWLDSKGIRLIFPGRRSMYWIWGLHRIYLEDFSPLAPPERIFIWESVQSKLDSVSIQESRGSFSGFPFDQLMSDVFKVQGGTVTLLTRDNLKSNLDYQQHLKGALLKVTQNGNLNLAGKLIPAGMWLKDIVYLQSGQVALIRYDYLYQLPALYTALGWDELTFTGRIIRVSETRTEISLETLYLPESEPLSLEEWLELP